MKNAQDWMHMLMREGVLLVSRTSGELVGERELETAYKRTLVYAAKAEPAQARAEPAQKPPMRYAVVGLLDGGAEIHRYPDGVTCWADAAHLHSLGRLIGESDTREGGPSSSHPTADAIRNAYLES